MKRLLLGAAMLAIAMNCPAETKQALTLHMASGASIVYFLDTQPVIGFEGQTMVVTVDDESTDIPMQDVGYWEIGESSVSAIESLTANTGVNINVYGNTITVNNPEGGAVVIYNLSGQIVASDNKSEADFTLPRGIYIISIANNTYKIIIR